MMKLQDRISALAALGNIIENFTPEELENIYARAQSHNTWFTPENVQMALTGVRRYLQKEKLEAWTQKYTLDAIVPKRIGLVLAGNIPLVGFHDFLSVLVSGHKAVIKTSHQDPFLLPYLTNILIEIAPEFEKQILFTDQLKNIDAIIATGSDNSSRYFEYYFSKYPHIIRKNRTSVAILTGKETKEELNALGRDIFSYYGLGCRNISKVFIPKGYDFTPFFEAIQPYETVSENHKYVNNYDYNKSIYLVNKVVHQDNGFLLVTRSSQLVSPISVLFYEEYNSEKELASTLEALRQKLQCIVAKEDFYKGTVNFGIAQAPELEDYADGVDTVSFLEGVVNLPL